MKPRSIQMFDKLFWISVILGFVYLAVTWSDLSAELEAEPEFAAIAFGAAIVGLVFGYGVSILLWFLISKKANNVARWIYIVLTALGVVITGVTLFELSTNELIISIAQTALTVATIVFLVLPDAAAWFDRKGTDGQSDISTFE
ncbi:hypothetical protein [Erythrobacter crassostreae]|uniref:Uncharacterized protein n=1 Tax=Erythrobacter crassostreae TaxID=2828328 RepID=A0A9X1F362_9SPHN|nr:hypothetical protein [Erythrobacter crassostrea]MBV7258643.1 hypothetical protein [Erythrobacter crassostrea]